VPAEILEACVVESRMEAFFQILRGVTGRLAPAGRTSRRAEPCPESSPLPLSDSLVAGFMTFVFPFD
jgi:hypothetical protein